MRECFNLFDGVVASAIAGLAVVTLPHENPLLFGIGLAITTIATFVAMFVLPYFWCDVNDN